MNKWHQTFENLVDFFIYSYCPKPLMQIFTPGCGVELLELPVGVDPHRWVKLPKRGSTNKVALHFCGSDWSGSQAIRIIYLDGNKWLSSGWFSTNQRLNPHNYKLTLKSFWGRHCFFWIYGLLHWLKILLISDSNNSKVERMGYREFLHYRIIIFIFPDNDSLK